MKVESRAESTEAAWEGWSGPMEAATAAARPAHRVFSSFTIVRTLRTPNPSLTKAKSCLPPAAVAAGVGYRNNRVRGIQQR